MALQARLYELGEVVSDGDDEGGDSDSDNGLN